MSYSNNPNSFIAGTGIVITPVSGTGANTVTLSAPGPTGPSIFATRTAVTSPDVILASDSVISYQLTVPGPVAVTLPLGISGTVYYIKDGTGDASINPIVITPSGGQTVDDSATAVINTDYGSLTLVYTGVKWEII